MNETADIVVIGAGIAGIGAAAHLASQANVVVLEREKQPGYHATGRSAAVYIETYGNDVVRMANRASRPYLENPADDVFEGTLLTPRGMITIFPGGGELRADLRAGVQEISETEAREMVPILRPGQGMRYLHKSFAFDIDTDRLLQGWRKILLRSGGRIRLEETVTRIQRKNQGWTVATPNRQIETPVIVNAGGAWADSIARLAGVAQIGLQPMRRSMAVLPVPAGLEVSTWPVFEPSQETWYAKPEAGKLLVSPADEDPVEPFDAYADDDVIAQGLYRFEQAVDFPVTRVDHVWAGLRTFAPDHTPVLGFESEAAGFFWLAGQGGYGFQTAPALSALAAKLILGSELGDDDMWLVHSLSPARFRKQVEPSD